MNRMSSLTGKNKAALLSLVAIGVAITFYAVPIAVFAQDGSSGQTWHDKHFEGHHYDKDSRSYKDNSGREYKCETKHGDFYYYFYNSEFYRCDDYNPANSTPSAPY